MFISVFDNLLSCFLNSLHVNSIFLLSRDWNYFSWLCLYLGCQSLADQCYNGCLTPFVPFFFCISLNCSIFMFLSVFSISHNRITHAIQHFHSVVVGQCRDGWLLTWLKSVLLCIRDDPMHSYCVFWCMCKPESKFRCYFVTVRVAFLF